VTVVEVVSIIVGCLGLLVAVIAVVRARIAESDAQQARADAAEALARSSAATERALTAARSARDASALAETAESLAERAQSQATQALTRAVAAAEEASIASHHVPGDAPAPGEAPDPVRWECEQVKGMTWVARNVGSVPAHGALLSDASRPPKYIRPDEVIPRDVQPGDQLPFRAYSDASVRAPRVRLTWSEDGDRLPRAQEITLLMG
jgi:hypothetical protein